MDKILAIVFMLTIITGFYAVHYVADNYENGSDSTLVFTSDSGINFPTIEKLAYPYETPDNFTTALELHDGIPYFSYPKTPVYLGSETWSISINSTSASKDGSAFYVIELPNLENYLIDEITINQTKNNDADLKCGVSIISVNDDTFTFGDPISQIFSTNSAGSSSDYYNLSLDLSLGEALDVYDLAQGKERHFIRVNLADQLDDGMSAWAWEIEITITGKQIAQYNLPQQISMALLGSIILNVIVMVYMTDSVDWGGYVNDIPDKKRRS